MDMGDRLVTRTMIGCVLAVGVLCGGGGAAYASEGTTALNGADPRPFYIFAHNPNTIGDVEVSLAAGATALEPDVTTADDCDGQTILVDKDSDIPFNGGDCDDTKLVEWLDAVHNLAIANPQLALIVFDIKSPAASAAHGVEILDAVREHLNFGPVNVNVIFSVATRDDGDAFTNILSQLGEREGVQVDSEDDAADIVQFFFDRGYPGNIGYGDGTTFQGPNLPRALDKAAFLRAALGFPKAVTYVFTLNHDDTMDFFINGGVDGIIPDRFGFPTSVDPSFIQQLAGIVSGHPEVRMGTRADNPFKPALQSYGVQLTTSDDFLSGTDADVTFTLNGCRGSASIVVNAGAILIDYGTDRLESGNTDWTTIPSANLGKLSSIAIFNDGTGISPDWKLVDVAVASAGYLGADFGNSVEYRAHLDDFIDDGTTVTLPLTPNFAEPKPTIQCPAPITVANAPGLCSAPVTFAPVVNAMCPDVTAVSSPASGSAFPVATTTVISFAQSPSTGQSDPCSFTVTVLDAENPSITCPAPITVDAVSPQGAPVSFAPTASDNCSVASLTTSPVSGSMFAIGTTTVTGTAVDPASNASSCTFTVHVKSAAEQIQDLTGAVTDLPVGSGLKNALLVKLDAALAAIARNDLSAACGALGAFINLVEAQTGKAISVDDAAALVEDATRIRAVIGC
jgi:hypothetical protein